MRNGVGRQRRPLSEAKWDEQDKTARAPLRQKSWPSNAAFIPLK